MKLITLAEVARRLGVSEPTARKLSGQLPGAVRLNNRTRYREDAVTVFIERGGCVERVA